MASKEVLPDSPTLWVPVCCQAPMRFNVFQSSETTSVATLTCVSCSKHFSLQPHTSGSVDQYGGGTRVLKVLGIPKPVKRSMPVPDDLSGDQERTL